MESFFFFLRKSAIFLVVSICKITRNNLASGLRSVTENVHVSSDHFLTREAIENEQPSPRAQQPLEEARVCQRRAAWHQLNVSTCMN